LAANRIGLLIEAGVSHQATVAHKHGWATDLDGQLRFMSDVGIVFTAGGDYVLNVFIHDRIRLDFDEGNRVIARLSQTVYNFFNIDDQVYWWFE
jgi:beta-lactamase class A